MQRIGFIGTGHIAAPMARALARDGHAVTVSERSADTAAALASAGLGIRVAANPQVVETSDIVFLCLRPAVWADVVPSLPWRAEHRVISVMAGVPLVALAAACAPATELSVTIPYGFIESGGCPLPVAGNPGALTALFGGRNPVLPQTDEAALIDHFAASTMTTAALSLLEQASQWLAGQTGDADQAEIYVANLVTGFLQNLSLDRSGRLSEARAELATPQTLNLQMVDGLTRSGTLDALPGILDGIADSMRARP
ncbi:NAD(P)-binding domain-containing protein [Puniceibacterium confluentis]|uniref:NAD(P)-binding domain-containing protein n=1 Tax=Puniceibacterium confluentis TaxID=1958944 RepID=UPI0011B50629|nr:NAD(P)-binding domain-containing protein [Puniceibacterium confluentis]